MTSCITLTIPVAATSHPVGPKVGTSTSSVILGLVSTGEGGIKAAAASAGITKISTVDLKTRNILGVYIAYETIVTGE